MKALITLLLLFFSSQCFCRDYYVCKSKRIISYQGVSCWYNFPNDPDVIDISDMVKIEADKTSFGDSNSYGGIGIHDDDSSDNGVMTGKRGGRYYINDHGNKTYVKH